VVIGMVIAAHAVRAQHGAALAGMQFDTCGAGVPLGSNESAVAEFLDTYPDIFIHAQAVREVYQHAPDAAWLRLYESRARAAADAVREFDLRLCQIVHGLHTNDLKLINDGLNGLKTLCERTDHAGMWLAYSVYLAHVDVVQFGRSPHSMSPMKAAVTQAVMRALAAHDEYPQRAFPASLQHALAYLEAYPAYAPFRADAQAQAGAPAAVVQYWNGLLCLRGTRPAAGAAALAAALISSVYVIDCSGWQTPLHVPSFEEYAFAVNGTIFTIRRSGAGYLYRARDGALVARVPRVAQWELTANSSIAAVRNALTPPGSYDVELIDLRTGAARAALYRDCAADLRVQRVAVAPDRSHAAVQYRLDDGACDVDVWRIEGPLLRGTLANRGGLLAGFTPDSARLVRSLSASEYALDALDSLSSDPAYSAAPGMRIATRVLLERYLFLRNGAAMLCWSQRRSPCDAWALCDTQRDGAILAARAPKGGYDGIAALRDGAWFATWHKAAIDVWTLAHGTRPRLMTTLTLPAAIRALAFSTHAPLMAAADARGMLRVWHLDPSGLQAWPAWATDDGGIDWLAFDLASAALYAHNRSNQVVYVAPLQAGGLLDSRTVTGWNPMTRPLLRRSAAPQPAVSARAPHVPATAVAAPPLHDTAYFTVRECLTVDYADLDGDGLEEALVSARGLVRALATGAVYFVEGVPLDPHGDTGAICPSNEYWYGVLHHDVRTAEWRPLLMGVSANMPDAGALPLVSCRFAAFSNAPVLFVEHAVQAIDGVCRRTLYTSQGGALTALFDYVYHAADAEIAYDPARARITVTEPLYPAVRAARAHVPLLLRSARFTVTGTAVVPLDETIRVMPAAHAAAAADSAADAELFEQQTRAEHGGEGWRFDALAYATQTHHAAAWRVEGNNGTTAVARASAPAPGTPATLVLYQPFLGRAATSIWHHAVPRTALPEWEQP